MKISAMEKYKIRSASLIIIYCSNFYPYWTVWSSHDKKHLEIHKSSVLELTHWRCPFSVSVTYLLQQYGYGHSQLAHNQQTGTYFMTQYQLQRLRSIQCHIFTGCKPLSLISLCENIHEEHYVG
jgi:hypothetical protein